MVVLCPQLWVMCRWFCSSPDLAHQLQIAATSGNRTHQPLFSHLHSPDLNALDDVDISIRKRSVSHVMLSFAFHWVWLLTGILGNIELYRSEGKVSWRICCCFEISLYLDSCLHAIKPPLPPDGFLICFKEIKSSSDEKPVSTTG